MDRFHLGTFVTVICLGVLLIQVMALPEQAITYPADFQGGAVTGLAVGKYTYMARDGDHLVAGW